MNTKELLKLMQKDQCGFTQKINDINDYYLVKVSMNENVYRNQKYFYLLFSNTQCDNNVVDLVNGNINMHEFYFIAHILGTKDINGVFKPLTNFSFGKNKYANELYVRDHAMQTKDIADIEVVTYVE